MTYYEHITIRGLFIAQIITELGCVHGWLTNQLHVPQAPRLLWCVFVLLVDRRVAASLVTPRLRLHFHNGKMDHTTQNLSDNTEIQLREWIPVLHSFYSSFWGLFALKQWISSNIVPRVLSYLSNGREPWERGWDIQFTEAWLQSRE